MRIAMIGSRGLGSSYGGIERVLNELCPRLADLGHSIDVYSRPDVEFCDRPGLRAIPIPLFGAKYFETISRSAIALAQAMGKYDLIHFHAVGPGILTLATHLFGQKSLVTIHGLDHERDKWSPAARLSLRLCGKDPRSERGPDRSRVAKFAALLQRASRHTSDFHSEWHRP